MIISGASETNSKFSVLLLINSGNVKQQLGKCVENLKMIAI